MKSPHIRRNSFWSYLSLAVPQIVNFGGDPLKSPTLVPLDSLPNLLFFAIYDLSESFETQQEQSHEQSKAFLSKTREKISKAVSSQQIPIFDPVTYLAIDTNDENFSKENSLVRLDDCPGLLSPAALSPPAEKP